MSLFVQIKTTVLTEAKFLAAGPEASWMYLRGLCWSKDHLTDGEVPRAALAIVGAGISDPAAAAQKLVDAKLWTETADGWTVGADRWAKHQQTKAQVEAKREADRKRIAERRKAPKRVARDGKNKTAASRTSVARDTDATPKRVASDTGASRGAEYIAHSTETEYISPPPRASAPSVAPAAPGGGGGGGDCAEFEGDLAAAVAALRALKVNRAEAHARQAGSERAVLYAVERARDAGVKNRAALAVELIRAGETPPEGWVSREAARAAHNETMAEARRLARSENAEERARNAAELELIDRHWSIAMSAAEQAAEGNGMDARTLRAKPRHLWAQHRLARAAVIAAIEKETGDTVESLLASGRESA